MKRFLVIIIAVLVVAAVAYYYYTWKISSQVDRLAAQVAPFGSLEYDDVSIGLGGEARINGIHFRPRDGSDGFSIRQIAVGADNLYALWSLSSQIEAGQVPRSMALSLRGFELAVDSDLYESMQAGSYAGLGFEAAGCGDRRRFASRDLTGMEYWDLIIDMDFRYQLLDQGRNLELNIRSRTHDMVSLDFTTRLELSTPVRDFRMLVGSLSETRMDSIRLEYRNLGYYGRMLEYCSNETDMVRAEYVDHHVRAWLGRWRELELRPGDNVADAYRRFLESPGRIVLTLNPSYSPLMSQFQNESPVEILQQFTPRFSVNNAPEQRLTLHTVAGDETAVAASGVEAESTPAGAASPQPSRAASPDTAGGIEAGDGTEARQPASGWSRVAPADLGDYLTQRVEMETRDGKSYAGRIQRMSDGRVHIQVRQRGGYFVIPVPLADVGEARVRPD